jgi:uncharacterized membrane protein YkvI
MPMTFLKAPLSSSTAPSSDMRIVSIFASLSLAELCLYLPALLVKILNAIMSKLVLASYKALLIIAFFPLCFLTLRCSGADTEQTTNWPIYVSIVSVLLLAIMAMFCHYHASKIYTIHKDLCDEYDDLQGQ